MDGYWNHTEYPVEEKLRIKVGAQIMMVNNDERKRWYNGSIGNVVDIDFEDKEWIEVWLEETGNRYRVNRFSFEKIRYKIKTKKIVEKVFEKDLFGNDVEVEKISNTRVVEQCRSQRFHNSR